MAGIWKGRKPTDPRGLKNPDVVMARLESGMPLKDAVNRSYDGYYSHCKLHPEWAQRAKALVERNARAGRDRKLEKIGALKKRAMTHCKRGHEFNETNTRYRPSTDGTGLFWRQCKICEKERQLETAPVLNVALQAKLIDAMKRDVPWRTLRRLCPDIIGFYRTVRKVETFRHAHHEWAMGSGKRRGRARAKSQQQKRYAELVAMLPTGMPMKVKADIIGAIYEAHGNRKYRGKPFGITKAKAHIKEFIADYWRANPKEAHGDIKTPWSLDAPIYEDGATTRADRVTRSIWDEVPL